MVERVNRRDQIVEVAAELFIQKGYSATSIRQIAEVVQCTEAAIYYHFKDGKRELLQEVVETYTPDYMGVLDDCHQANSIYEFVLCFGRGMAKFADDGVQRLRWITSEFPELNDEEKALIHSKHLQFHDEITKHFGRFIASDQKADHTAWVMLCTMLGYAQLFKNLNLEQKVDFEAEYLIALMAEILSA